MWFESDLWSDRIALSDQHQSMTYESLARHVRVRSDWLRDQGIERVALCMDNQIEWVLFDLACQAADVCCVPVPAFFSSQQLDHLIRASAIELLLCDTTTDHMLDSCARSTPFKGIGYQAFEPQTSAQMPQGTHKITFTSGTTGTPKGVCLSTHAQLTVAQSLTNAVGIEAVQHLCLLPLATLLENVAGVYAPLLSGGTVYLASEAERGFQGSRLTNPQALLTLISQRQPNSLILVPELLSMLIIACQQGWQPPSSLQFIAVGGAHVAASLLQQAHAFGLPVYQGYGLSECASVVALNTPSQASLNSVGQVLEHNRLRLEDQELVITGNLFLGYLNQPETFYPKTFATGDLANIDRNWLSITGRKKNILINSFGRNLSPEWIEAELLATQCFRYAIVFGEARPQCGAILVPISSDVSQETIAAALEAVNQTLPDYARIHQWVLADAGFAHTPGLLTATGKPIRTAILSHFSSAIDDLFQPTISSES